MASNERKHSWGIWPAAFEAAWNQVADVAGITGRADRRIIVEAGRTLRDAMADGHFHPELVAELGGHGTRFGSDILDVPVQYRKGSHPDIIRTPVRPIFYRPEVVFDPNGRRLPPTGEPQSQGLMRLEFMHPDQQSTIEGGVELLDGLAHDLGHSYSAASAQSRAEALRREARSLAGTRAMTLTWGARTGTLRRRGGQPEVDHIANLHIHMDVGDVQTVEVGRVIPRLGREDTHVIPTIDLPGQFPRLSDPSYGRGVTTFDTFCRDFEHFYADQLPRLRS